MCVRLDGSRRVFSSSVWLFFIYLATMAGQTMVWSVMIFKDRVAEDVG